MKVYNGTPQETGWYLNIIPRVGVIGSDPSNFIGIWTDFYNETKKEWMITGDSLEFWAYLPDVFTKNGELLIETKNKDAEKFLFNAGFPHKIGCYLIVLPKDEDLMLFEYCENNKIKQKINSIGAIFQADHIVGVKEGSIPDGYYCDDLENAIGWIEYPELVFQDGTTVNFQ
jgi:hypothetical protein